MKRRLYICVILSFLLALGQRSLQRLALEQVIDPAKAYEQVYGEFHVKDLHAWNLF